MKYVYSTLAISGLAGGMLLIALQGFGVQALLAFIFGAVCAVASEICELGARLGK